MASGSYIFRITLPAVAPYISLYTQKKEDEIFPSPTAYVGKGGKAQNFSASAYI